VIDYRDTFLVSRLHSSRRFSCLGLGSFSTLASLVLARVSNFRVVSSCLMSHDCVLHVSLRVSKCLFSAETLAFLAESRPVCPFTRCLLTYYKTFVLVVVAVFTAALRGSCGHYIFALWFLLLLSFFPRLISAVADWMFVILAHIVWP